MKLTLSTPKYQELRELMRSIVYYFTIVEFVRCLQNEEFEADKMERLLRVFEEEDNYDACCFLYIRLMDYYSKSNKSKYLNKSIQHGLRLYGMYENKVDELSKSEKVQNYEIKRLNFNIFKLLRNMLALMLKGADQGTAYTYEQADGIHDQIMKYLHSLSKNNSNKT